jgi:ADP-L-glycero-D-manno-heptose 6-epimerase
VSLDQGTILVTGGAGFIGSALIAGLNARGHDRILVADVLDRSEKWRNLVPLRFDDYLEAESVRDALERGFLDHVRAVFHLGACSSTTETDAGYLMRNNVQYSKMLADWAVRRQVRFVYASSAATYGATEGVLSDESPLGALRPLNMYGYSKHLFDLYAARRGYLERIVGLKYFNVFGPNEGHKGDMRSVVCKAFEQIRDTGQARLFRSYRPDFADGEQRRDFVYVKDAVAMTLHLAETPAACGIYNVASGRSETWLALVQAVFDALARPARIEFIDMPPAIRGAYQYSTMGPMDRLRRTGYDHPIRPLQDAVREYVCEYLVPDRRLGDEPGTLEPGIAAVRVK